MAASTAESVPAKQQIMRSVEGPPFATPYFGIWILCRGQLFVIIIVAQAVGPAFLPLSLAAFAYEYTFLGYQPAAQIHLLRTALDIESFKWLIINSMKAVLVGDDAFPVWVEDDNVRVSPHPQLAFAGKPHHLGGIGCK